MALPATVSKSSGGRPPRRMSTMPCRLVTRRCWAAATSAAARALPSERRVASVSSRKRRISASASGPSGTSRSESLVARRKPLAMTLKPPITTYGSPTALALATTPLRSGPEGSSWGMPPPYGGRQQGNRLLREPLALLEAFRRRQRPHGPVVVLALFAIELRPLGLVTGLEQRLGARSHVANVTPVKGHDSGKGASTAQRSGTREAESTGRIFSSA